MTNDPYQDYRQRQQYGIGYTNVYRGDAGQAAAAFIIASSYFIGGFLGYKAYKNHYDRCQNHLEAAAKGVNCGRRWTAWLFAVWAMNFIGLFGAWMLYLITRPANPDPYALRQAYDDPSGGAHMWAYTIVLSVIALWPVMLVIYTRNVDASLFHRNGLYHMVQPLARLLDRWSSLTLYCLIPVVPFAIAIILDIAGVV